MDFLVITSVFDVNVYLFVALIIVGIRYWRCRKECRMLILELNIKTKSLKTLKEALQSLEHRDGSLKLERLKEKTCHQINCLSNAVEFIPKYYKGYGKLQNALKKAQDFHLRIDDVKMEFNRKFGDSQAFTHTSSRELTNVLELDKSAPLQQCPLEDFLKFSPIEQIFWNEGAYGQKKKLEKEYSKLKKMYPDVSEYKLRRSMVFAYNYFKKNILILKTGKLQETVRKIINGDEDLGNFEEEEELCTICLEEVKEDSKATLECNHFFHPLCIRTWLKNHDKCPVCRRPQDRHIIF